MALSLIPPDGGGLYAETNLENTFPEPFNFITSLLFLGIALYWTFQLKGQIRQHAFLAYAIALLYVGGIGGSIYHGLRQWPVFIVMDWLPIMLLCLSAGICFMVKLTRWYFALALIVLYLAFQFYARDWLKNSGSRQFFINVNYAVLAAIVLFPVLGYLIKTKFKNGKWVGFALLAFVAALTFRIADKWDLLSIGTHFLWHFFGALAAFFILKFIYLLGESQN